MYFYGPYNPKTNFSMHMSFEEPEGLAYTHPDRHTQQPLIRKDCPPKIEARIRPLLEAHDKKEKSDQSELIQTNFVESGTRRQKYLLRMLALIYQQKKQTQSWKAMSDFILTHSSQVLKFLIMLIKADQNKLLRTKFR